MAQLLTISNSASLVGVPRRTLQKQIRNGELVTFGGKIPISELLRIYPKMRLENKVILAKEELVKPKEVIHTPKEKITGQTNPTILANRLAILKKELVATQSELKKYTNLTSEYLTKK
ncbi:MAG: hypothetical protein KAH84_11095 [Thiomargarita sp.]|nr:hypothetical protein [Thiomargarita sp.]